MQCCGRPDVIPKVLRAPCSALGRSKQVQRMVGYRFAMAAAIAPWTSPETVLLRIPGAPRNSQTSARQTPLGMPIRPS